jgi:hypothetical protein
VIAALLCALLARAEPDFGGRAPVAPDAPAQVAEQTEDARLRHEEAFGARGEIPPAEAHEKSPGG